MLYSPPNVLKVIYNSQSFIRNKIDNDESVLCFSIAVPFFIFLSEILQEEKKLAFQSPPIVS